MLSLSPLAAADQIQALPGWEGALPSRQFSGYLDLPGTSKHVHYWFVESEGNPELDPITLWLNGGPGCSSLDGLFYENGPLRFDSQNASKLVHFEYTWAKQSNMIYLEAPVGVGFSYSDDVSDYRCTDDTTAADNVAALEQFFERYPSFKSREFFITGESYGGVYCPTLAEAILKKKDFAGPKLTGMAVGNGCTGTEIGVCGPDRDFYTAQYFATSTGLLGPNLQEEITKECEFTDPRSLSKACKRAIDKMAPLLSRINIYDVYGQCINYNPLLHGRTPPQQRFKAPVHADTIVGGPDACINSIEASNYLQRRDVTAAIHTIPVSNWAVCNTARGWSYKSTRPNLPRDTYPFLIDNIRVVIYNGDFDACVPWTDNEAWTKNMGLTPTSSWHPWSYETKNGAQIGGYATTYNNNNGFTFTTIRGGRHEVPESAPEAAFELLRRLIGGNGF